MLIANLLIAPTLLGTQPVAADFVAAFEQQDPIILRADKVIGPDLDVIENGAVLVRGKTILAVGSTVPSPANVTEVRLQGVLAPGFMDACSSMGLEGPAAENYLQTTPDLLAVDAVDWNGRVWDRLAAHGVTALHVVPDAVNVVAGWSGLLATSGSSPADRVLTLRSRQTLSLIQNSWNGFVDENLGPTSLAGALQILRPAVEGLQETLGSRGAVAVIENAEGLRAIQAEAEKGKFQTVWFAQGDLASYGAGLSGQLVLLPALNDYSWSLRNAEVLRRMHKLGVRIAFGSRSAPGTRDPHLLRHSAMALSRILGNPTAGLAAITQHAAEAAGAAGKMGIIAPGARADLVLWSAHPLDATAKVKAVMIGGERVETHSSREDS